MERFRADHHSGRTAALVAGVFLVGSLVLAQQQVREYIRLGGRVIAIETRPIGVSVALQPGTQNVGSDATTDSTPGTFNVSTTGEGATFNAIVGSGESQGLRIALRAGSTCGPKPANAALVNSTVSAGTICYWVPANTSGSIRNLTIKVTATLGQAIDPKDFTIVQAGVTGPIDPPVSDFDFQISDGASVLLNSSGVSSQTPILVDVVEVVGINRIVQPSAAWKLVLPKMSVGDAWLRAKLVPSTATSCSSEGYVSASPDAEVVMNSTGSNRVCFSASPNSAIQRTVRVTAALTGAASSTATALIDVTQSSGTTSQMCKPMLVSGLGTLTSSAGGGTIAVSFPLGESNPGQGWKVRPSTPTWIKLSPTQGFVGAVSILSVERNPDSTVRSGLLEIESTGCSGTTFASTPVSQQAGGLLTVANTVSATPTSSTRMPKVYQGSEERTQLTWTICPPVNPALGITSQCVTNGVQFVVGTTGVGAAIGGSEPAIGVSSNGPATESLLVLVQISSSPTIYNTLTLNVSRGAPQASPLTISSSYVPTSGIGEGFLRGTFQNLGFDRRVNFQIADQTHQDVTLSTVFKCSPTVITQSSNTYIQVGSQSQLYLSNAPAVGPAECRVTLGSPTTLQSPTPPAQVLDFSLKTTVATTTNGLRGGTENVWMNVSALTLPTIIGTINLPRLVTDRNPVISRAPSNLPVVVGAPVTLEAEAQDLDGNLQQIEIAVTAADERVEGVCIVRYNVGPGQFTLLNDSGSALPYNANVANSQCILRDATATVLTTNSRKVAVRLEFKPGFAGGRVLRTRATDSGNLTATVPDFLAINGNPSVTSVVPSISQGLSGPLSVTFADPNGATDLQHLYVKISEAAAGALDSCFVYYSTSAQKIYVRNDSDTGWGPEGGGGNSRCQVSSPSYVRSTQDTKLATLSFNVNFVGSLFSGTKSVFAWALDNSTTSGSLISAPVAIWHAYPAGVAPVEVTGTGLTSKGVSLAAIGGNDENYFSVGATPDTTYPGPTYKVVDLGILKDHWVANSARSQWISPRAEAINGNVAGNYQYRHQFDLSGYDSSTARVSGQFSSDNGGKLFFNDVQVAASDYAGFGTWVPFVLASNFRPGLNTLRFEVNNPEVGPTGLQVAITGAYAVPKGVVLGPITANVLAGSQQQFTGYTTGYTNTGVTYGLLSAALAGESINPATGLYQAPASVASVRTIVVRATSNADQSKSADATIHVHPTGARQAIATLSSTGVSVSGTADTKWKLVGVVPGNLVPSGSNAQVISGAPSSWSASSATSKWIGPSSNQTVTGGTYFFQTEFNLSGYNSSAADIKLRLMADDTVPYYRLNGTEFPVPSGVTFDKWATDITLPAANLLSGLNTLEIAVTNDTSVFANPVGLRAELYGNAAPSGTPPLVFASTGKTVSGTPPQQADERYWVRHLPGQTYAGYSTANCPSAATGVAGFNKAKVVTTAVPLSSYYGNDSTAQNIARWISTEDTAYTTSAGMYIFRQELDLTGYNPATTVFRFKMTGDDGAKVFVNCQPVSGVERVPGGYAPFQDLGSEFTIPGSAFQATKNYVDFAVPSSQAADYTALRVEMTALTATPTATQQGTLTATPVNVAQGGSGTSQITVSGFSSPVTLSSGTPLPAGITLSAFTPSQTSNTSSVTVSVGATVTPATYTLPVTGTAGSSSASTTITLNVTATTSGTGRSYVSNGQNRLLATIPSVPQFTSMGQFRWEFRVHDFVPSTSATNNQYFFGFGPGYPNSQYGMVVPRPSSNTVFQIQGPDNPGSCSLGLGSATTDFVMRVQKDSTGRYRLGIWNGTTWLQDENCLMNGTPGANLSGIMNFPAGLWGNGLQGNFAYLRLYGNAESFPFTAPPDATGAGSLLRWEFEDNLTEGVGGSANMTMYPALSETPGTATYVSTPGSGGGGTAYTISGTVTGAAGANPVTLSFTNGGGSATTDASSGIYSKSGLAAGTYRVTPSKVGYRFAPAFADVTVPGGGAGAINFVATAVPPPVFANTGKTVVGTAPILDDRYWVKLLPGLTYGTYTPASCPTADGFAGFSKAKVVTASFPLSAYYGNDAASQNIARWIATEETALTTVTGLFVFRQELDLTEHNHTTTSFQVRLSADDGVKVYVNCQIVPGVERIGAPGDYAPFNQLGSVMTIPASAFRAGKNYVDFVVSSVQTGADYTGLRVEMSAPVSATPTGKAGERPVGVIQ